MSERCLDDFLRLARRSSARHPANLKVPTPKEVRYGCNPWTPERDIDYQVQHPVTGEWTVPTAKYQRRDLCRWCLGNPAAAGQMCPGCHRFGTDDAEDRLKRQRKQSREYRKAGVPLETPPDDDPPGQATE